MQARTACVWKNQDEGGCHVTEYVLIWYLVPALVVISGRKFNSSIIT